MDLVYPKKDKKWYFLIAKNWYFNVANSKQSEKSILLTNRLPRYARNDDTHNRLPRYARNDVINSSAAA